MSNVCPAGHFSTDDDYCCECGKPMRATAAAPAAASTDPSRGSPAGPAAASGAAPGASTCPDCGTPRAGASRYCEVCRYDFPAGQSFTGLSSVSAPSPSPGPVASPAPVVSAAPVAAAAAAVEPGVAGGLPARAGTEAGRPAEASRRLLLRIVVDESLNTEPDPATPCPTDAPARVYHLDLPENTLGRQYEAHGISPEIVVNDPGISRRHVKFVRTAEGAYEVLELGSANGTKLNAVALQTGVAVRVEPGDQLTLGMWTRIHVQARQAS